MLPILNDDADDDDDDDFWYNFVCYVMLLFSAFQAYAGVVGNTVPVHAAVLGPLVFFTHPTRARKLCTGRNNRYARVSATRLKYTIHILALSGAVHDPVVRTVGDDGWPFANCVCL